LILIILFYERESRPLKCSGNCSWSVEVVYYKHIIRFWFWPLHREAW
jgi:hypothetical protein